MKEATEARAASLDLQEVEREADEVDALERTKMREDDRTEKRKEGKNAKWYKVQSPYERQPSSL